MSKCALWLAVGTLYMVSGAQVVMAKSPGDDQRALALRQVTAGNAKAFPDVPVVDVAELERRRQEGGDEESRPIVLIDVRSSAEQAVSMLPGAITAEEFEKDAEKHAGADVVTYCTVGYRSARYAQQLGKRGIRAASLEGGIIAWCQASKPLTGQDGRQTNEVHVYGPKWDLIPPGYVSKH